MFLSKYGVARHIYIPMIKRAVVDFAVGADWTPAAGDVKISKDGGAAANVTNLPTAIAMGNGAQWDFSLTATEMQAAQIMVTIADSATKAVEDSMFIIETYGNASAQHAVDLSDAVRAGLTALPNAAAGANGGLPLGDASGRVDIGKLLGTAWLTPGTPGTPDVNVKLWNALAAVALPLIPTVAGRTLDVSAGGEGGVDWANVGSPSTANNLSGTTVKTLTDAPSDSAGVTTLLSRLSALRAGYLDNLSAGAAALESSLQGLITTVGAAGAGLTATATAVWAVATRVLTAATNLTTALATPTNITAGTITTVTTTTNLTTNNDKTGYALTAGERNSVADALLDRADAIETGWTVRKILRILGSALGGKLSGAATATVTVRDVTDAKDRITASVDADGNRTAVTLDGT